MGLTGRWGLGKSSVLNLVAEKLGTMDQTIVAEFNPWLFKGREELLSGFFTALRSAMGKSNHELARELQAQLDRYWSAINLAGHGIAALIDLHGGSGTATAGWKSWGPRFRQFVFGTKIRTPEEERRSLEGKLAKLNCAVVVLIDELDRVEDDEVRAVAQLIKAVGDIRGVSYLVAYDQERVVQALGRNGVDQRTSGEAYLEKIIQHPIPLRPLFEDDAIKLLQAGLEQHGVNLAGPATESQKAIFDAIVCEISTPREIKRLIGAYAILENAVRNEICPYDVLAYCWILTKSPSVRDQLAAKLDDVVSDPSRSEAISRAMRRRSGEAVEVASVLGDAAKSQERLLKCLFPVFGKPADGQDWDRLFQRRNLVRMLYLGDPPGIVSNREIERVWNLTDDRLGAELGEMLEDGKLQSFIDRLDDLLPTLPPSGDEKFWVALSHLLHRRTDWLDGPEDARAVADDAGMALYRLGLRDPRQVGRVASCIAALKGANDLVLAPWLLRKLLFAHGLTNHSESPRGNGVLDGDATIKLLEEEIPRYRAAVLDGTALRRLPNVEAIYVLANTSNWTPDLRDSLTEQLAGPSAIATLAGLLVPPGYSTDRQHLNELFDAVVVQERLEALESECGLPSDGWLAESSNRLLKLLKGADPMRGLEDDTSLEG